MAPVEPGVVVSQSLEPFLPPHIMEHVSSKPCGRDGPLALFTLLTVPPATFKLTRVKAKGLKATSVREQMGGSGVGVTAILVKPTRHGCTDKSAVLGSRSCQGGPLPSTGSGCCQHACGSLVWEPSLKDLSLNLLELRWPSR